MLDHLRKYEQQPTTVQVGCVEGTTFVGTVSYVDETTDLVLLRAADQSLIAIRASAVAWSSPLSSN